MPRQRLTGQKGLIMLAVADGRCSPKHLDGITLGKAALVGNAFLSPSWDWFISPCAFWNEYEMLVLRIKAHLTWEGAWICFARSSTRDWWGEGERLSLSHWVLQHSSQDPTCCGMPPYPGCNIHQYLPPESQPFHYKVPMPHFHSCWECVDQARKWLIARWRRWSMWSWWQVLLDITEGQAGWLVSPLRQCALPKGNW